METSVTRTRRNIRKSIFIILIFIFSFPQILLAANLNLSPASGTYNKDSSFSVGVFVSSADKAINAVSTTIKFPSDKLQVTSISKNGSIINFWAQEPTFSNTTGEIKIEGVVLTPGFLGNSGKILTINFKGKNTGTAGTSFLSSSVLANDGIGTDVLTGTNGAVFTIKDAPIKEPEVIKLDELKPATKDDDMDIENVCEIDSIITSSTHPGVIWRKENTAIFSWELAPGASASKIAFDKNKNTEPTTTNTPAISEKTYENIEDGIWYFHLALKDGEGWSPAEHFKIKIDSTAPELDAREIERTDINDPRPVIQVEAIDKTSCLENIELSINGEIIQYEKLESGDIRLEEIGKGVHELTITARDRAGNTSQKILNIVVGSKDPVAGENLPTNSSSSKIKILVAIGIIFIAFVILITRELTIRKIKKDLDYKKPKNKSKISK